MRELLRGAVRLHVLHHASEGDIHGSWMAEELGRHGYAISYGTLYPILHRMEDEGLLSSRQEVQHGRVRRVSTSAAKPSPKAATCSANWPARSSAPARRT